MNIMPISDTKYRAGDVVRIQLCRDGKNVRWYYSEAAQDWIDQGYGGPWVDALITATTYEQGAYQAWPEDPIAVLQFSDIDDKDLVWHMPLEKHPWFPTRELHGFPKPARATIPKCDCGADAVYGTSNMAHEHYCSKGQMLRATGFIK
jgi:hypothetical protein